MQRFSILSEKFEESLLEHVGNVFEKLIVIAEKDSVKRRYIKKKDFPKYVDVSTRSIDEWEKVGLKRMEPIEGGSVYYDLQEIDRFMKSKEI